MQENWWYNKSVQELTIEQQNNSDLRLIGEQILWLIDQRLNFSYSHPNQFQRTFNLISQHSYNLLLSKLDLSFCLPNTTATVTTVKVFIAIHYLKFGYDLVEHLLLSAFGLIKDSDSDPAATDKETEDQVPKPMESHQTPFESRRFERARTRGRGRGRGRGREKLVKPCTPEFQKPLKPKELPPNFKLEMNNSDYKEALSNVIHQINDLDKPTFQTSKHFLENSGQFRYMTTVMSTDKKFKWSASAFSLDMEISEQMAAKNLLESITGYKFA
ncbi:hypothetical protein K7432_004500 [Basidiobolus ranarum]|uniref:DRBM domain-containing protein n=1 Tax=Basidiobolus ranarum TaxID=34480 RepID=A0ABR2W4I1_9FUNG